MLTSLSDTVFALQILAICVLAVLVQFLCEFRSFQNVHEINAQKN